MPGNLSSAAMSDYGKRIAWASYFRRHKAVLIMTGTVLSSGKGRFYTIQERKENRKWISDRNR